MLDAYIYDGLRSPFGRHGGALASVRPDDLLATVMRTLIERNSFAGEPFAVESKAGISFAGKAIAGSQLPVSQLLVAHSW